MSWLGPALTWTNLGIALACGVAAAAVFFALRRLLSWLLGPIFTWETVRLARKGHTFWLRITFALLLLGLLYWSHPEEGRGVNRANIEGSLWYAENLQAATRAAFRVAMQKFADEFSRSFLLVLAIGTVLVTPLYLGTAVSEEKERRMLDFLLATQLTSREIVLGKLAARLLTLFGVLLAGLPILALTQLWGGVDWLQILKGFAGVVLLMLSCGSASLLCSVIFSRTRTAVILGYVLAILLGSCVYLVAAYTATALPELRELIAALDAPNWLANALIVGLPLMLLQLILILICVLLATRSLRYFANRHAARMRKALAATRKPNEIFLPHPMTIAANPPVGDSPLLWKEHYLGRTFGGWLLNSTFWLYCYLILGVAGVSGMLVYFLPADYFTDFGLAMRAATVALGLIVLLSVSLRMAASISREREQQTLVSLLTLPMSRSEILYAKWMGTLMRSRRAVAGLIASFAITMLVVDVHPLGWVLLPMSFLAHLWFFGNAGLFLSVLCRSTNRAYTLLLAGLLGLAAIAWTVSYYSSRVDRPDDPQADRMRYLFDDDVREGYFLADHVESDVDDWLNPPQNWWRLMIRRKLLERMNHTAKTREELTGWFHSQAFVRCFFGYAVAGSVLLLVSVVLFRRRGFQ